MTPLVAVEYEQAVFVVRTDADEKFFINGLRKDVLVLGGAMAILRDAGRPSGGTFVDVGAHIGTTTISALTHEHFERAVAIEPDPDNVRLLRANLALNGLAEQVTVIRAAISNRPGAAYFVPGDPGMNVAFSTKGRLTAEPAPGALPIDVVTLDGLVEQGVVDPSSTGLLWLDCQKCEQDALQAASRFLAVQAPVVFALRHRHITAKTLALAALERRYARFADLRRKPWEPAVETLPQLLERRSETKGVTDVLVF